MLAENQTVDIEDQQFDALKASLGQTLQLLATLFDKLATDGRFAHPHAIHHLRDHLLVIASRNIAHQDLQKTTSHSSILVDRLIAARGKST